MSDLITKLYQAGINVSAIAGSKSLATLIGVDNSQIESVLDTINQPSLCFIPIQSETLVMRRTADIGTTMLISQTNQQKEYITDNSAPRPRTWSGTGYISSLAPLAENYLAVKPTLQVQQAILEAAADSRQPVKFKTDTGEVVDVLVQDLQISASVKGMNVRAVSYVVQEVKILENSIYLGYEELEGKAAMKSIPVRAITNLGKNSLLGAGVADSAIALLAFKI